MSLKQTLLATVLATPFFFPSAAHAGDYCREYTKSIRVGGHMESGYGTACLQPDGSWMIVSSRGAVDPFDDLRGNNVVLISDQQPVYYTYGPYYRPVTYYPRPYFGPRFYTRPGIVFSFTNVDRNWDRHDWRGYRGYGHGGHDSHHGGRHNHH